MKNLLLLLIAFLSIPTFAADEPLPPEVMQAKTVYIVRELPSTKKDPTGQATFVEPRREELNKWGRFKEVSTKTSGPCSTHQQCRCTSPECSWSLDVSHPKRAVCVAILEVFQRSMGKLLWSLGHSCGGFTRSAKSATTAIPKEFRNRLKQQEKQRVRASKLLAATVRRAPCQVNVLRGTQAVCTSLFGLQLSPCVAHTLPRWKVEFFLVE